MTQGKPARCSMKEARECQLRVPAEGISFSAQCSRVGGLYRLESIPVASEMIACGDTFEADEKGGKLVLRRVFKRASRRNYSFVVSDKVRESKRLIDLLRSIETAGGVCERLFGGVVMISMPSNSSYDPTPDIVALDRV